MSVDRNILLGSILSALLLVVGLCAPVWAAEQQALRVTISLDIPPYVMNQAGNGLEIDIMREALAGHPLQFSQLPYQALQTAIPQNLADVSVGVQADDSGVNYSVDFITFANYAIGKKADGLRINKVADLRGHQVLTWENAYLELGKEFEEQYAPQAPERKNYLEVADQREQVRKFWEGKSNIIVIDYSIFVHLSKQLGYDLNQARFFRIFEPVTNFKAGFKDAGLRDKFNQAIAAMCKNGKYAELMKHYGIVVKQSVCN
jgi:polar amino acid transport system substrate-binding protein